jgi:hypothetical protein
MQRDEHDCLAWKKKLSQYLIACAPTNPVPQQTLAMFFWQFEVVCLELDGIGCPACLEMELDAALLFDARGYEYVHEEILVCFWRLVVAVLSGRKARGFQTNSILVHDPNTF